MGLALRLIVNEKNVKSASMEILKDIEQTKCWENIYDRMSIADFLKCITTINKSIEIKKKVFNVCGLHLSSYNKSWLTRDVSFVPDEWKCIRQKNDVMDLLLNETGNGAVYVWESDEKPDEMIVVSKQHSKHYDVFVIKSNDQEDLKKIYTSREDVFKHEKNWMGVLTRFQIS